MAAKTASAPKNPPTGTPSTACVGLPQLKVSLLQIEYVAADVPPGGSAVYSSVQPAISCPRNLEPAGHSFHEKALSACGIRMNGDVEDGSDEESLTGDGNGQKVAKMRSWTRVYIQHSSCRY